MTPAPPFVEVGVPTTVRFEMPNERPGRATTSLVLVAPPSVELAASEAPTGWSVHVSDERARWTGGRIERADVVSFPLLVTARAPLGPAAFRATQGYDDGRVVHWNTTLTVLPRGTDEPSPPQRLDRALVAGGVGLLVLAGSLVALRFLRTRA